jgi:hypothetical protein
VSTHCFGGLLVLVFCFLCQSFVLVGFCFGGLLLNLHLCFWEAALVVFFN